MDRVKVIPFSEYKPRRKARPRGLMAAQPPSAPAPPPVYTSPEDDPACKYNGKYVVAGCYCKYPDFYTKNKDKYNLDQNQIDQYNYYCWQQVTDYPSDPMCNGFKTKEDVTMDCYCQYPAAYQNKFFGFSSEELSHMDAVCKKRAARLGQPTPPVGFGKFAGAKLGAIWDQVSLVVTGILSPKGLKMILEFVAVYEVPKHVLTWALGTGKDAIKLMLKADSLKDALTKAGEAAAERGVDLVGEEMVSTIGAYITGIMGEAIADVMATATLYATGFASLLLAPVAGLIFAGIDALMLAGMVFDLLGERFYGYNHQLAAKDLVEMSDSYNQIFMQVVMAQLRLPGGNEWPVEFFADNLIAQVPLDNDMKTSLLGLQFFYIAQYLSALTFNSSGEFIYHASSNQPGQFAFNKSTVQKTINDYKITENLGGLSTTLLLMSSNDNVSVVIFLRRNWFILVILILIVVIFVLYIK